MWLCVPVMLSWNLYQFWSQNTKVTFFFLVSFLAASDLIACVGGSTLRPNGEGIVSSRFIFFTLGLPTLPFTSLMALPKLCSSRSWASTFWEAEHKDESWFKCSRLPNKITLDKSSLHKKTGQLLQEFSSLQSLWSYWPKQHKTNTFQVNAFSSVLFSSARTMRVFRKQ